MGRAQKRKTSGVVAAGVEETKIKVHIPHLIAELGDEQRRMEDAKRLHEWLAYIANFVVEWGRAYHMKTTGDDATDAILCRKPDCKAFRRLADYVRALDDMQTIKCLSEEDQATYVPETVN